MEDGTNAVQIGFPGELFYDLLWFLELLSLELWFNIGLIENYENWIMEFKRIGVEGENGVSKKTHSYVKSKYVFLIVNEIRNGVYEFSK